jgi:transposase
MTGALHFIGGVVQLIVPDNPRAVIAQCDRFEPRATDSVLDFARHYGTSVSILPARPHTPQDKAKARVGRAGGGALDHGPVAPRAHGQHW